MNSLMKGDDRPCKHSWTNLSYKLNYAKKKNKLKRSSKITNTAAYLRGMTN